MTPLGLCHEDGFEKVYSREAYMSNPPMHFWICRRCFATGHNALAESESPNEPEYCALMAKAFPDDLEWRDPERLRRRGVRPPEGG